VTATCDPAAFAGVLAVAARRPARSCGSTLRATPAVPTRAEPGVLRLAAHGIPTAVVRHGDDLTAALSGRVSEQAAHG
jgi:hypothetical protein